MTLTIAEIKDLAQFAGLVLDEKRSVSGEELDSEITIEDCPPDGLDDDGTPRRYEHVAYLTEYPEEGSMGLGSELPSNNPLTGAE